ncbi:MAG: SIMPL domain-containing protein [Anaerolineales bacterium]|jgi:uncharacterized protein YggE|nr:SIMPL domain-containing protein [Anaerolineales bacterium]
MRNKFLIVSILMVFAVLLSACGSGLAGQPAARTMTVTGAGQVSLKPDIAYINIGVHTEDPSAADAVAKNNADTQKLIDALKAQGVAPDDLRTADFSIWTNTPYNMDGQPGEPVYVVDNTVYVTVRDLAGLGNLLDAAVRAGANNINSIQFDVVDKSQAMSTARKSAVEAAEKQAQELAAAAGVSLGAIQTISYYDNGPYPVFEGKSMGGGAAMEASVPINPGQMQLNVTVTVSYEIK